MNQIVLASGCNAAYYPQMRAFMKSVQHNNTIAKTYVVGVCWQPPNDFGFTGVHLPVDKIGGHGGSSWCVQHGGFLHALPAHDDDVIVFTDGGDVTMQRDFSEEEVRDFLSLKYGTVLVGQDLGQNLGWDARRLRKRGLRHLPLPSFDLELPVYNTGVVICTAKTYWRLYEKYMEHWSAVDLLFDKKAYARQQWLMSAALGTDLELRAEPLSPKIHTHGHAGFPKDCSFRNGVLHHEEDVVLFRHRVEEESLQWRIKRW